MGSSTHNNFIIENLVRKASERDSPEKARECDSFPHPFIDDEETPVGVVSTTSEGESGPIRHTWSYFDVIFPHLQVIV